MNTSKKIILLNLLSVNITLILGVTLYGLAILDSFLAGVNLYGMGIAETLLIFLVYVTASNTDTYPAPTKIDKLMSCFVVGINFLIIMSVIFSYVKFFDPSGAFILVSFAVFCLEIVTICWVYIDTIRKIFIQSKNWSCYTFALLVLVILLGEYFISYFPAALQYPVSIPFGLVHQAVNVILNPLFALLSKTFLFNDMQYGFLLFSLMHNLFIFIVVSFGSWLLYFRNRKGGDVGNIQSSQPL